MYCRSASISVQLPLQRSNTRICVRAARAERGVEASPRHFGLRCDAPSVMEGGRGAQGFQGRRPIDGVRPSVSCGRLDVRRRNPRLTFISRFTRVFDGAWCRGVVRGLSDAAVAGAFSMSSIMLASLVPHPVLLVLRLPSASHEVRGPLLHIVSPGARGRVLRRLSFARASRRRGLCVRRTGEGAAIGL